METLLHLLTGNTLSRLVFFPALACLPLLFFRRGSAPEGQSWRAVKGYTLAVSLIELGLGLFYAWSHRTAEGILTFSQDHAAGGGAIEWIPSFGVRYDMAADGISLPLALLAVFLLPLVVLGSYRGIDKHWPAFSAALLLLTSGTLGALFAHDLFLFYVFWEVMLIPMYLIIGIWGGERRVYAAVKFFLFTMAGSLLMLVAILWLAWTYRQTAGAWSFGYQDLLRLDLPLDQQLWLFGAFALAFLIKVPVFPLHTWLPDAHVEAPTGGSVILAGILLKLGTYGFLRFAMPLFPHANKEAQPLLLTLALIGILYGAMVAWVQVDMKKLVAYSSVAHLGFVMLGLLAVDLLAWQGALIQMINHGLSTGALFLLVGMLYDRRHTKQFADYSGIAKVMPVFAFFLVFSALASVGLPALNGFVGEFLILLGTYRTLPVWAALATFGVVLAAIYLLKMLYETLWGPLTHDENRGLSDLSAREIVTLVPLCVLMLWIGVAPNRFLEPSRPALEETLARYQQRLAQPPPEVPRLLELAPRAAALASLPPAAAPGAGGLEEATR
jgi:NADH-quinone oxidoreductase subunit M